MAAAKKLKEADVKKAKSFEIYESFGIAEALSGGRIDKEAGILRGVAILPANRKTANNNIYSEKILREALTRYEGAKMFIDHDKEKPVRSVKDFGGVYKNLRLEEGRLRADLHVVPSKREMIFEIAEMQPAGMGVSIRDKAEGERKDGVFVAESFVGSAYSIDFVSEASANKSLFEGKQLDGEDAVEEEVDVKIEELTIEALRKDRADLVEALVNEGKSAVLKDLEEAKAKGTDASKALLKSEKTIVLFEAKFEPKVHAAALKMIEPESVTLESAKGIISAQKEMVEAIQGKGRHQEPDVRGAGKRTTTSDLSEAVEPTVDDVANALRAR